MLKEIHDTIQREQQMEVMGLVEEVETHKDDSIRMFQAVKQLQRKEENYYEWKHGVTRNEINKVEIVTHSFNDMFNKDTAER